MQTKLTETTAVGGFGSPSGKKLFKVSTGSYAGRMLTLLKTSDSEIKYCFSNSPYDLWSALTTVVSDSSSAPIDAVMTPVGDVYLVYCEASTNYLVSVKLTINSTGWSIGSKVYIYNGSLTNTPSITIDNNKNLYVCFSRYNSSTFDLHVKTSIDTGVTWGTGPTDLGEMIASGLSVGIPKIMTSANDLFVVYVTDWTDIKTRNRALSGTNWSTEYTIASSVNIDEHFDAIVLPEGFLGVVYDSSQLNYREFDGSNWGPVTQIDSQEGFFPQVTIVNNVPVILYLSAYNTDQYQYKQSNRITGTFSTPTILESRAKSFDNVLLYDNGASSYEDKSYESASNTVADVFHSSSSGLCGNIGDKVYIGSTDKFRYLKILLSTAGSAGMVTYSYFDGSNWNSFTPSGGSYQLDSTDKELLLWEDFASTPLDWQKNSVNGTSMFWLKIEVVSGYTTMPIGSQITSISNLEAISVRR